ncbi:serine/threonine phosphatase [Brasilonema sp. UFV-L1]|uniref:serine/threonine phosphatase n=1 Tax=Brasilonema sp. UFV-L1 TaxID=2234130 RepID=UPI00145D0EAC|nr:serine/threonine phosphatase [Brasilonema sp. UFV-L1]NMG08587.1 serine/threonine protein phosphatase [Brasilonema sp. UFV-L1]
MLICPQCKFENPNTNKFCQSCGASLTHKVCSECGTHLALDAQQCDNCGTTCGAVLWAIITKEGTFQVQEDKKASSPLSSRQVAHSGEPQRQIPLSENSNQGLAQQRTVSSSLLSAGSHLDSQKRYQLLESLPALDEIAPNTEVCVKVLDCQPYQVPLLEVMVVNEQKGLVMSSLGVDKIPSLAKPYVALQSWCHQGIPPIHDAWQQDDMQIVLIEDRSNWRQLLDLWQDDSLSSSQIVHFFYQMTQLWAVLENANCRQSLLELCNLRVNKNQSLALQRLYVELPDKTTSAQLSEDVEARISTAKQAQPLTIQALGQVWHALFRQSQRTQFGSILHLMGELEQGNIQTLAQLQLRLEAIASELQGNPTNVPNFPKVLKSTAAPTILQLDKQEDETELQSNNMSVAMQPVQLISLENAGLTNVGRQRDHNEDYFGIETKVYKLQFPNKQTLQARGLYILCDGMGGHAGGEVASALAVNSLRQYFQTKWASNQLPTEDDIYTAVRLANQEIFNVNQQDARSGVGRMGTTLVMVLIQDTHVAVAHVGDSRLYRVTRERGLEQVTIDHEVGQREISRGVEPSVAYSRSDAYQLTQALGPRDENSIIPDIQFFEINEDTLFVLASDGLSDNDLLVIHWQDYLVPLLHSGSNLESGVQALIDLANHYNGHDNITAVLIRAKVCPNSEQQQ